MIALVLGGCGGGAAAGPTAPPAGTALATVDADGVAVGEARVSQRDFERDPTRDEVPELVDALAPRAGSPLWVDVPADTPFWKLRRVVGSARAAGLSPVSFRVAGAPEVHEVVRPERYGLGFRCAAPVPVTAFEPLVTLSVQAGGDGAWVVATSTFLPVGPDGPVDGYPPECLAVPPCGELFADPAAREACERGGGQRRVDLGGEWGCLLPIAKSPEQVSEWRRLLPGLVERLGLADLRLRVVMPEAKVRVDAVAAVLDGLTDAGLRPALGTESLVEGNDGPPVCMAVVRDRATMAAAAAAYAGSLRAAGTGGGDVVGDAP